MRSIVRNIFRLKYLLWILPFATLFVLIDGLWYENYIFETNTFYFKGATANTNNIKIVQISDVHFKGLNSQLLKIASDVNAMKPDLICLTGDVVDNANFVSSLSSFLGLFNPEIKMVAITGNWEYWANVDLKKLDSIYKNHNCDLLINSSEVITIKDQAISVSGIDDMVGGKPDLAKTLKQYKSGDINLFLTHCPVYRDTIIKYKKKEMNFDLMLAGHSHGGQLNLFGFVPYLPKGCGRYCRGMYDDGKPPLYVCKGIGNGFFPLRIGCITEISVFNFKKKN